MLLAAFALLIARDQFQPVDDFFQSWLRPDAFSAIQQCRQAALAKAHRPDLARLIEYGRAQPTQAGWFIDRILVGEMRPGTDEQRFRVSCHVDAEGRLANVFAKPELSDANGAAGRWPFDSSDDAGH